MSSNDIIDNDNDNEDGFFFDSGNEDNATFLSPVTSPSQSLSKNNNASQKPPLPRDQSISDYDLAKQHLFSSGNTNDNKPKVKNIHKNAFYTLSDLEMINEDPQNIFIIQDLIGQGAYGAVYKAIDSRDNCEVAVKVINVTKDISPLKKEIDILKECHSPYITQYKGCWKKDEKTIWIVMEYCGAGSVCDLMTSCEYCLTEDEIAVICKQVLLGLKYLHEQHKIHRDIKCGNILLTPSGDCKLGDFGVSAQLDNTTDKRNTLIGTPYWMAPEVLQESQYDGKADIWSLGITVYEMAIGRPPHSEIHPMRAIFMIPKQPPPSLPSSTNNTNEYDDDFVYSPEIQDFVKQCCIKDHHLRPSASDLLENHPFILHAGDQSIIRDLVKECIDNIEQHRIENTKKEMDEEKQNKNKDQHNNQNLDASNEEDIVWDIQGTMIQTGTMVEYDDDINDNQFSTMKINQSDDDDMI